MNKNEQSPSLRNIPYPYQAMLAICSDLDETRESYCYFDTLKFLNTEDTTSLGPGVGLETGNTIYFDMPPNHFSYWNTDDKGRSIIKTLIKSGHIDCLHSYGDLATTRGHAERALSELVHSDCYIEVWIDHGRAPSNFGRDIMRGEGDLAESAVYHADITMDYGIRYVWMGRVTSIFGQDTSRSFTGIWHHRHPVASAKTLLKEFLKGQSSWSGSGKYAMHKGNKLITETRLRSGHGALEFIRSNPHWGGVSCGDTAAGIAAVLTETSLSKLVLRGGSSIIYTHLGKPKNHTTFSLGTIKGLKLLARYYQERKILVTTTNRLLRYRQAIRDLSISTTQKEDTQWIDLKTCHPEEELQGLSLYVDKPERVQVSLNGKPLTAMNRNNPDHTGRPSISIPWKPLEFPRGVL